MVWYDIKQENIIIVTQSLWKYNNKKQENIITVTRSLWKIFERKIKTSIKRSTINQTCYRKPKNGTKRSTSYQTSYRKPNRAHGGGGCGMCTIDTKQRCFEFVSLRLLLLDFFLEKTFITIDFFST